MALSKIVCLDFTGKPDSFWSWVVCICAALSQAITMGFLFSFGVLFPIFMEYFRETREKTGEYSIITWQGLLFHMALVWVLIGTFPSSSGQLRCRHPVSTKFQTCGGSLNAFCHQTLHLENSSGYFRAHSSSRWNIMQIRSERKCEKYEDFLPWRSQFSGLRL